MPYKPIIAVTMGDPSGIGPEIILKALADPIIKAQLSKIRPAADLRRHWGVLQRTMRRNGRNSIYSQLCDGRAWV